MTLLISYVDEPESRPIFTFKGDSGTDPEKGFYQWEVGEWDEAPPKFAGKTIAFNFLTYVIQAISGVQFISYPMGANLVGSGDYVTSVPFIYDLGTTLPGRDGGNIQPFVAAEQIYFSDALPLAGAWPLGAKFYNRDPLATEWMGWTCVAGGTPGTWKGFGVVET